MRQATEKPDHSQCRPPSRDAEALSDDGFLDGRLQILQPKRGYRAGMDAVFVAAAVACKGGESVFEAGTGTGVAALCLARRVEGVRVTGLEISPFYRRLARDNAERNGLDEAVTVVAGDIRHLTGARAITAPPPGSFHHVFANPPFYETENVPKAGHDHKARARAMAPRELECWIEAMIAMAAPRGTITLIHRAQALERILAAFARRVGGLRILPLFPRAGRPASRVIVRAIEGSRAQPTLLPGIVLHGRGHGFTPQAEAILHHGRAVAMATRPVGREPV
ncbi:MAG: methyltransferase domain-containing protein [Hyphomicrobiales bacterium]